MDDWFMNTARRMIDRSRLNFPYLFGGKQIGNSLKTPHIGTDAPRSFHDFGVPAIDREKTIRKRVMKPSSRQRSE
jgi:hypothetical protein